MFVSGFDPVTFGMVGSLNRPGGNATGIYFLTSSLEAKRLELLKELVPKVAVVAFLVNPDNPNAEALLRDTRQAARTLGLELRVLQATNESDISKAFLSAPEQHMRALLVGLIRRLVTSANTSSHLRPVTQFQRSTPFPSSRGPVA